MNLEKIKKLFGIQIVASLSAIFLVIFAIIFADIFYHQKTMIKKGFEIAISDGKLSEKKEEKPVDLATLLKTADFDRGVKIFKKCATCHSVGKGEAAKVGPNLYGVIGRKRGSTNFSYSEAMKAKGGAWDSESINLFITKPKDYLPGTKMGFAGLKKPQDRADVIFYLQKQK